MGIKSTTVQFSSGLDFPCILKRKECQTVVLVVSNTMGVVLSSESEDVEIGAPIPFDIDEYHFGCFEKIHSITLTNE
jgi:hypothetical protein